MPLRSKIAAVLLTPLAAGSLAAQTLPPPDDLPKGAGPRGTSQAVPGQERYDEVGYATVLPADAGQGPMAVTHRSLPPGTYVEITSLDNGKTIAALVVAGPPPASGWLIGLSVQAAQQLGMDSQATAPVRVRKIEPSQPDLAALNHGQTASQRLDAPQVLLVALRKRLSAPPRTIAAPTPAREAPVKTPPMRAGALPARKLPPPHLSDTGASYPVPATADEAPRPARPAPVVGAGFYVQIAALSNAARADALAADARGIVVPGGGIYRVRLGPYRDVRSAENARDAAVAHGYADARIVHDQ
jgi:rare lipoprotein A